MTARIRKAQEQDFLPMISIYQAARQFMRDQGNPTQWGAVWPPDRLILQDILDDKAYVCTGNARLLGCFYFAVEQEPAYQSIQGGRWLNAEPYGVIHRIAVGEPGQGVGKSCLEWALSKCQNLRIDTHADNLPMRRLLQAMEFTYCGIVHMPDDSPRMAFHKISN